MYYTVKLINDSVDNSYAEIVPYQQDESVVFYVSSKNKKMKAHLESLLSQEAYVLSPGRNTANSFSDGVTHIYPNSIYHMQSLPEILSWHGYFVRFHKETHKSVRFMDDDWYSLKSANDSVYYNKQGERIVRYVPQGYVAVHQDGRVVAGGKYLNANIDKEGASWVLTENPYEDVSSDEREIAKQYMDMALQEYHPGIHDELYERRNSEDDDYFVSQQDFSPSGKKLNEHFDDLPSEPEKSSSLVDGKIIYSPDGGFALNSSNWPPNIPEYDKYEWYVFNDNGLSDEEKEMYASLTGEHPMLLTGLKDSEFIEVNTNLPVDDGLLLSAPEAQDSKLEVDLTTRETYSLDELNSSEYKSSVREAQRKLNKIKDFTREVDASTGELKVSEELKDMKISDLQGDSARFRVNPYPYQKAGILALTETSQYEAYGGPKGWHGHYLNWTYGLGKTAVVSGANAVMRNRGHVRDGEQTTIVTAPNKNIFVWQSEIGKFLGEHAEVIDGPRDVRVQQWEELLEKARNNQLPPFVIVGSSKFRYLKNSDSDLDDDEKWELDVDAQYMKLLSQGGRTSTGNVRGKHVGIFTVDESGQYVNPDSARHSALQEMIESVYQNNGITWTLNGDISGNSATDTISEISFVNAIVRDNYLEMAQTYTKTNRDTQRQSKQMNRRIWQDQEKLREFMRLHGDHIYPLNGKTVAGEDFGFKRTEDASSPLGKNWGAVYEEAGSKMRRGFEQNQMKRTLGLMSLMIGASYGAVSPQRLFEYDLGTEKIMEEASSRLSPREFEELKNQLEQFYMSATETKYSASLGRLPVQDKNSLERDNIYKNSVDEEYRILLENVVMGWDAPILNQVENQIEDEILSHQIAGSSPKMGVAGFSKMAIRNLYNRLREKYSEDKFLIQVVDGDIPSSEVRAIQDAHQNEKDRTVITLVTGAGLYGLSLPADRSWRFPTWNSAKAGQYEGRFHRKAEQKNTTTVVVPDGIAQYMREIEEQKASMAKQATGALINADDSGDELEINNVSNAENLLGKLSQYKPRILEDS